MIGPFSRSELILGPEKMEKIKNAHVLVFGVGGVGSFVVEALVRTGLEKITLVDHDTIAVTNLNRQLHTTWETIGQSKVDVMAKRINQINPEAEVRCYQEMYLPEIREVFFNGNSTYNYVVDAIDTVTAKIDIAVTCDRLGIPLISAMGAGNKLDPTQFQITDLYKTHTDPLAKVMRRELRKRGVKQLKVVFSTEEPVQPGTSDEVTSKRRTPGSLAFVPSVEGLIMASEVIRELVKEENND